MEWDISLGRSHQFIPLKVDISVVDVRFNEIMVLLGRNIWTVIRTPVYYMFLGGIVTKSLKKKPLADIAPHGMSGVFCWALLMSPSLPGTIVRCFQCMTHRNFLYHSHIVLIAVSLFHMFFLFQKAEEDSSVFSEYFPLPFQKEGIKIPGCLVDTGGINGPQVI